MKKVNKRILNFFSVLSDETRLNIVLALTKGEKNVGGIHRMLGKNKLSLPAISQQLRQMENLGIVVYEKKGREKIFRLADGFCWCIVKDAMDHLNGGKNCKCKECCKVKSKSKGGNTARCTS